MTADSSAGKPGHGVLEVRPAGVTVGREDLNLLLDRQARQPHAPLESPDMNFAGLHLHYPAGQRCSVAVQTAPAGAWVGW